MAADRSPIDFAKLAAALLDRAEFWVSRWLPAGHREGHEWVEASTAKGGMGDSFKVNLVTGKWSYFAGHESGGDLISLFAYLQSLNNGQAARELMRELGWVRDDDAGADVRAQASAPAPRSTASAGDGRPEPPPDAVSPVAKKKERRWKAIAPVPSYAPPPVVFRSGFRDERRGGEWVELEATRHWEYRFEGQLYGYVARFERVDSHGVLVKDTKAYTWCVDEADGRALQGWHWKQWEAPRPLYVPATLLSADLSVPVVLVEGEKCAQAGHELLGHEFDFVSWPGGARAWAKAGFGPLMGRTVYLWPDCDAQRERLNRAEREQGVDPGTKPLLPEIKQPGMAAMVGIGSHLVADHGCTVYLCRIPKPGEVGEGWDIADAIAQGWAADRVRDFIRSAVAFVPPDEASRAKTGAAVLTPSMAAAKEVGKGADEGRCDWLGYLLTSQSGAVRAVRENVALALDGVPDRQVPGIPECAGLIAFNQFSNNIEKRRPTPWGTPAGDWQEADELLMGDWLLREHRMPSMSRQALEEAVVIVAHRHAYHPLRQRIEGLRGQWDQVPRLDTWLRRVLLEEDEYDDSAPLQRYLTLAGRWFVMGMCARVMTPVMVGKRLAVGPGVKFDYMLVLESPTGWGKSTFATVLGGDYFADTGLDVAHKDSLMNIQGIWLYEWSELDQLAKQDLGAVKRFISSPSDRFRATFDRRPAKYPRQVVFVGTTEEAHYLLDHKGNRRFWPVRVTRPPDNDWLAANMEQLLAEAVHRVDQLERFWPTREEQRQLFDPQQQMRKVESSIESAVRHYLYDEQQKVPLGQLNGSMVKEIGLTELLNRIGYTIDKQSDAVTKKAASVLHMLGWDVRRTSLPGRPRVYVRPAELPPTEPGASDGSPGKPSPQDGGDDDAPF